MVKVRFWSEIVGKYIVECRGYDDLDEEHRFEFEIYVSSDCSSVDKQDTIDCLINCHCVLLGLRFGELCSIRKITD